jgi:ABC-2 type transport system ATP-binding protein
MYGGSLLAEGEPEALRAALDATVVEVEGTHADTVARLARHFGAVDWHGTRTAVRVPVRDAAEALARVRGALGGGNLRLATRAPDFEDVFMTRLQASAKPPAAFVPRAPDAAAAPRAAVPSCAIEATGLTRDFGGFRAVDAVSFRVRGGEVFGLLGANGAGKTTVIKMLTGILPPTAGCGQVAGADMRRASGEIRRRIGYMSQAFSLYADLTVRENVRLYAGVYGLRGRAARERAAWVVEMGGLGEHLDDTAGGLPMGLRQRLALGCAILHRPDVLFLDEPTSGVDPLGRRRFWNILSWLAREERVAILLTTHHMAEADLCDHVVLLFDGRVVADASPAVLKRRLREQAGLAHEPSMDDVFVHEIGALQAQRT